MERMPSLQGRGRRIFSLLLGRWAFKMVQLMPAMGHLTFGKPAKAMILLIRELAVSDSGLMRPSLFVNF